MQFLLAGYRSGNDGDVMVPLEASIKPPQASEKQHLVKNKSVPKVKLYSK